MLNSGFQTLTEIDMSTDSAVPTRSHDQVVRIRRMIKKWLIRNNSYDLTRTN